MNDTVKFQSEQKPRMVAHRGLSGLEQENTHAAFVAAGNRSYWGVETDIRRTQDGHYVCMHDNTVARVCGDAVTIEQCNYETVRSMLLREKNGEKGRTDVRIPSLAEYVRICKHYGKVCVLELKGVYPTEHLREVLDILDAEEWRDHTVIIDFTLDNLIRLREIAPDQPAQYLISGKRFAEDPSEIDRMYDALNTYNLDLDIYHGALTAEMSARVHADGHVINVWTVDDPENASVAVAKGIEYITSNILE